MGAPKPPAHGASIPLTALYRNGPWLVVHGQGVHSEDIAHEVHGQCEQHGVDTTLRPTDETTNLDLARYPGLVVVTPSEWDRFGPKIILSASTKLVRAYRARRPDGLRALLDGRVAWYDAGVAQVVGHRDLLDHSAAQPLLERSCARHYTDHGDPVDLFAIYTGHDNQALCSHHPFDTGLPFGGAEIVGVWQAIQAWKVTDIALVPVLYECINHCRQHYEDARFPAMHRPVHGRNMNRLDFLLDESDFTPDQFGKKAWMENGARAARYVMSALRETFPDLERPARRNNTKDLQQQLNQFYYCLKCLKLYLELVPENEWPPNFS